jgi:secondary thiamine-phosphate synthase enzyme
VWVQKTFELPAFKRGCHIITKHIYKAVPEVSEFRVGIAHIFVLHTSASLTINENASSDVPLDMEDALNRIVPEGNHYRHLDEGYDDMPAHVKASMMGSSLTIPITAGRFKLGIWQGIWLNEHRNYGGSRSICITIQGEKRADGRSFK